MLIANEKLLIFLCCSQHFMGLISRLPGIGLYVHMLGKVTGTVVSFFATYLWSLLGYAVAFHLILPSTGAYAFFGDSVVKVLTMLLGEYEYNLNFVQVVQTPYSWIGKAIFVYFLLDMSIVLMNLVLGLAVSDIDQLQKNSAVRRMIQETYTVMFIDGILSAFASIPGINKMTSSEIMGENARVFKDVYYVDIVDLEPNASNRLAFESYPKEAKHYPCPHNIIANIAK